VEVLCINCDQPARLDRGALIAGVRGSVQVIRRLFTPQQRMGSP